jgi:hypothetical protein
MGEGQMIERHRELFRTLPDEALHYVAAYFGVGEAVMVREALEALSPPVDLADVAWALCQAPDPVRRAGLDALGARYSKSEVERPWPRPLPAAPAGASGTVRVSWVDHDHSWLPLAAPRRGQVRVRRGASVAGLLAQGVTRTTLNRAVRAGRLRVG